MLFAAAHRVCSKGLPKDMDDAQQLLRDDAAVVVRRDRRAILATTRVPQRRLVDAPTLVRRTVLK